MNKLKSKKLLDIRSMTIIGILSGISIVLGMTPLGFIPIGPAKATTMHIPVIIGALAEGPFVGGMVGLIFGLFSIFQAVSNPTPVSFVFLNPLVSVLPRILIGVISGYLYRGLKKIFKDKNNIIIAISTVIGSLINTLGVLTAVYIIYGERFVDALGVSGDSAFKIIAGIGLINGIPEAILAVLIVTGVIGGLKNGKI